MLILLLGLLLFVGIHSVSIVAPAARDRLARRLGDRGWKAIYSLVAFVGLLLLVHGYGIARQQPTVLYAPPIALRHLAVVLMLPVFPLLLAAYLPGRIQSAARHPMLVATKLWAVAHLLANGTLADVLLFGTLLAWAVADRISLKRRVPRPVRGAPARPYNDAIVLAGGLLLYALTLLVLHRWLTGVSPLA